MTRRTKIAFGITTILPILSIALSQIVAYRLLAGASRGISLPVGMMGAYIVPVVAVNLVIGWGMLIFYVLHVSRNEAISEGKRPFWRVALLLGNLFVMPVYWYLFIWREAD